MARPGKWQLLAVVSLTVLIAALAVAYYAFYVLRPIEGDASGAAACLPQPCLAPQGFEAYFTDLQLSDSRVSVIVRFVNHTRGGLEAVFFRHTSPADFRLQWPDGSQHEPVFAAKCPNWSAINVERGSAAGPETLCFAARPTTGLSGVRIIWDPDLGLFTTPVTTQLNQPP